MSNMSLNLVVLAAWMWSRYWGLKQLDTFWSWHHALMEYSVYDAKRAWFDKVIFVIRKSFEEEFKEKRVEIFNKLIDEKKSFIVIINGTDCESTYNVSEVTETLLKQRNYQYFLVSTPAGAGNGDKAFQNSKLDIDDYNGGAIAIVKEGKLYASTNPDADALKSEEDIINWLSKYIDIE